MLQRVFIWEDSGRVLEKYSLSRQRNPNFNIIIIERLNMQHQNEILPFFFPLRPPHHQVST
jgi:hypothetical protein